MEDLTTSDPRSVGPYRIVSRIGSGGMGVVYLAEDSSGRRVALKLVRPELADDAAFRLRFRREVQAGQRVGGICTAKYLDADLESEHPYLVTEYVEGGNLADYLAAHGPLSGEQLIGLAVGLAEAVVAMHASGVIHRDLKPTNVLMAGSGPKVVDFGISHAADGTALTQTGIVVGSPSWMAPEQAQGRATTPAVDVFSWGATVAFAATGRFPFGEGRPDAVIYRVVHEEPDLAGVDPKLRPFVVAALSKDPAARPAADRLLVDVVKTAMGGDQPPGGSVAMTTLVLDRTWVHEPPSATPPKTRRGRQIAMIAASIVVIAAFVAGALYVARGDAARNTPSHGLASGHSRTSTTTTTTIPPTTTSTMGTVTTTTYAGFDYAAASLRLQQLGYDPVQDSGAISDEPGPLNVITGTCAGSATGYCQNAFFFYDNRYLGTDVKGLDLGVSVQWTTSDVAALSYPLYAPGDAHCCPSGGTRSVRFEWNGSALVPLDPLPPYPNSTTGQGSISSGDTGTSGSSGNTGNS